MNDSPKSNSVLPRLWRMLAIGVILVIGGILGIQALSRMGGLSNTEAKPVEPVVADLPTVKQPVLPPAPVAPPDPKEQFQQWAKAEYGISYIKADTSSIFVEFPADKYTSKEDMTVIAKALAEKWGQESKAVYINCRIYQGTNEFANGTWTK